MPITNTDTEDQVVALSQTVDDLSSDLSDLSTKVLYIPETKKILIDFLKNILYNIYTMNQKDVYSK